MIYFIIKCVGVWFEVLFGFIEVGLFGCVNFYVKI